MARPDAQAIGLYYPTPNDLIPSIAALLKVPSVKSDVISGPEFSIVDPCAGDGDAVIRLGEEIFDKPNRHRVQLFTCEMEKTRSDKLDKRKYLHNFRINHVHGDAMRLAWEQKPSYGSAPRGASVLFHNPPYDHDREYKRLEERFLRRFAPCLSENGVLVHLVPFYALSASADTIARWFTAVKCYRFPESHFPIFKQVVLIGARRSTQLAEPDPWVRAQVMRWSESVETMPVLGSEAHVIDVPAHTSTGFSSWKVAPLDLVGLKSKVKLWNFIDRAGREQPIAGVVPEPGDLLARTYPIVMPPKPAHLAAAIASGVFNGARVTPDDPASKLPPLLVKGVFDKEFVKQDEKVNKDGEKTGEVQVQQPKLKVTVLDLSRSTYHTLKPSPESTGAETPADMTTGDLLKHYGQALMRVMLAQCPVTHDPQNDTDRFELPTLARPLFRAQEEAVRGAIKLLGGPATVESKLPKRGIERVRALRKRYRSDQRRGRAVYILGEIGSGKTQCSLATAAAIGAKRVLAMCPPHLLQGWTDQVRAVLPDAKVSVLDSVEAVDRFCTSTESGMHIAILSRETAKLGHAYGGVSTNCPKCGAALPVGSDGARLSQEELAKKRTRCSAVSHYIPASPLAHIARDIALELMLVCPSAGEVNQLVRGRHRDAMLVRKHNKLDGKNVDPAAWHRARPKLVRHLDRIAERMLGSTRERAEALGEVVCGLLAAVNDDAVTADLCERVYVATVFDDDSYGTGMEARSAVRNWMLLIQSGEMRSKLAARLEATQLHVETSTYGRSTNLWRDSWSIRSESISQGKDDPESYHTGITVGHWQKHERGAPQCAVVALNKLTGLAKWKQSEPCGEPLFQAIPEPRRVALANYLAKKYPRVIDCLILDECHELAGEGSAQSLAGHRLSGLGMPVIALTGSVMNGYAESLFNNQWALDPVFRQEFQRSGRQQFVRRYGYIKILVQHADKDGKVVEWGSVSDRQEVKRTIGNAPGVLPLFVLRYLLRMSVTLHKTDLALDLPKCHEIVEYVEPSTEIKTRYEHLLKQLKQQIKADRFEPDLAGLLFGALSELPSYLDRATGDTGNRPGGAYVIAYPESSPIGPRVIAEYDGLPASEVLPKEKRMLEVLERELAEGRRMMLFAWHEAVLPRLQRLVESELKEPAALLLASKVQASKRQDWIDKNVIAKKRRVLVVNPVCVQTGLNNLVWFSSEWWHQNPGCNPIVYRQAVGRVDRIGQKQETRIYIPVYDGTAQALAEKLLMHKVGVSMATDGLDAESALAAAGVGESDGMDAMSVGRALFEMIERGESQRVRPVEQIAPVVKAANDAAPAVAPANDTTAATRQRKPVQLGLFG